MLLLMSRQRLMLRTALVTGYVAASSAIALALYLTLIGLSMSFFLTALLTLIAAVTIYGVLTTAYHLLGDPNDDN